MNIDRARGFIYDLHFERGEPMQHPQKFLIICVTAFAVMFAFQAEAKTPPPKPRPTPTPTPTPMRNTNLKASPPTPTPMRNPTLKGPTPSPTPMRNTNLKPPMPTPTPIRNSDLKAPSKLPPQVLFTDLVIDRANQTSANFWIVRIRNAGSGDAGASSLQVKYIVPPAPGGFPGGESVQGSFVTPPLKAGAMTDINVKTPQKTTPEMKARFALNADHTVKESNYANNTTIMPASPAYK